MNYFKFHLFRRVPVSNGLVSEKCKRYIVGDIFVPLIINGIEESEYR